MKRSKAYSQVIPRRNLISLNLDENRYSRNFAIDQERFQDRNKRLFSFFAKYKLEIEEIPKIDMKFSQMLCRKRFQKKSALTYKTVNRPKRPANQTQNIFRSIGNKTSIAG